MSVVVAGSSLAGGSRSRTSTAPTVLGEVRRPEADVAVWRRDLPASLRDALVADVSMLLGYFVAVARTGRCGLFFGVIRDDQCRKFHVDAVAMRIVTTYVGPGTEWLSDDVVDRAALARLIECRSNANVAILRDPSRVRCAQAGDLLVLKGSRDPNAGGRGAVHRSPPLREREVRLVLIATAGAPPP
jgi:hypothetical protein